MKRRTILSILLAALAFVYCYRTRTPSTDAAAVEPARELVAAAPRAAESRVAAPIAPAPSAVRAMPPSPLTDARRRILDTPDALATIRRVSATGTADEKSWALHLLFGCVQVNARKVARQSGTDVPGQAPSDAAPTPSKRQLEALKKQATAQLEARCQSVQALTPLSAREDLQEQLRIAAVASRSVLGQLEALSSTQDDRWNSEQAQQITSALYSGDPVLAQAAFFTLLGAMDRDSPGGQDRNTGLTMALGPIYTAQPLSDFERLSRCVSLGRCGSVTAAADPEEEPTAAALRLADQYRAAVAARADARTIMAIR